jgi:hypothetical protein
MATSTYSGDPSLSDKDTVRFLIRDIGPTNFDFSDEEIVFLLETECNYWLAAATLSDQLAIVKSGGGLASKSVGGLSESYSQGSIQFYQNQAKAYRLRGSGAQVPKAAAIPQIFSIGQFDSPGVSDPSMRPLALSWRSEEEVEP